VNLVAGGLIIGFCKRYEGEVCAFHRDPYSRASVTRRKPHQGGASGGHPVSVLGTPSDLARHEGESDPRPHPLRHPAERSRGIDLPSLNWPTLILRRRRNRRLPIAPPRASTA
jgi:hypothetical protein